MALPKMMQMTFETSLPSDGRKVVYRAFRVKEEKALLVAAEAKDVASTVRAVTDIVAACVVSPELRVDQLPFFDLEFLFLRLRAKSVGEKIDLRYRHAGGKNRDGVECNGVSDVVIDLDTVGVEKDPKHSDTIDLGDGVGVKLRYPTLADASRIGNGGASPTSDAIDVVAGCIESVFVGDQVHSPEGRRDALEWVESLSHEQIRRVMEFFKTMPALTHAIEYSCPVCGQTDHVVLRGVNDFFH